MNRILLSPPHMGPEERRLLLEAFDSNWIAPVGPQVDAFEREFARAVAMPCATALSSGTAGLHLALILLGVSHGDEVILPTLTFAATANAVSYTGATPVFLDSEMRSWNIDPDLLAEELRSRVVHGPLPKAVIAVDLYGQCADYDRIESVCAEFGVPLIEDAAEALGASYQGRPAGSFGSVAVFSFNGNKIITTGGGGMLVSRSAELVERASYLASQARDPAPHYEHSSIGFNYRLSNLLAAVGRGQLEALPDRVAARRAINARYRQSLGSVPGIQFAPVAPEGQPTHWLTCILIDASELGADREAVRMHLDRRGIEARPTWKPMHLQPVFDSCRAVGGAVAADIFERGLCLPSGSSMTFADLDRVTTAFFELGGT